MYHISLWRLVIYFGELCHQSKLKSNIGVAKPDEKAETKKEVVGNIQS